MPRRVSRSASPPDVFRYSDYRAYLKDAYAFLKRSEHGFSYGAFARRPGVSRSYLTEPPPSPGRAAGPDSV